MWLAFIKAVFIATGRGRRAEGGGTVRRAKGGGTVRRAEGGGTVRRTEGGGTGGQTVAAQEGRGWPTVLLPSALLPIPVTIKTAFLKANHIHKRFHWS